jgi:membrane-bound serine protease (ClpP class)
MTLVLAIYVVSLFLLVAEAFVPGLIMGLVGLAGLGWSIWQAWQIQGWPTGVGLTVVAVAIVPLALVRGLRGMTLNARIDAPASDESHRALPGMEGTALTPLRPTGVALISGHRTDVLTRGEPLDRGAALRVVSVEGARVVVAAGERRQA